MATSRITNVLFKFLVTAILAVAFAAIPAFGQAVQVTGNLKDLGLANATSSNTYVQFTLMGYGSSIPRVIGSNVFVNPTPPPLKPNSSGIINGTITGNDAIDPAGTYYQVCIFDKGISQWCNTYNILTGQSPWNLNTATPIVVPPPPTTYTQYARTFGCLNASPSTTWTCNHQFGSTIVVVQCFDMNHNWIVPDSLNTSDPNNAIITFLNPQAGNCTIINAGQLNLTNQPANAVVTNPNSDQNIIGFNLLHNGGMIPDVGHSFVWTQPQTFTGNNISDGFNNVVMMGGPTYPCTAAGFNAAIAALPSSGGTVDGKGCLTTILSATVSFGTATQPITVILGSGTYTFTNTSGNGFQLGGSGSRLIGQGVLNSQILCSAAFTGDLVHVEPATGNSVNGIEVGGFRIDATACPGQDLLNILSVRDPSQFHNLDLRFGTATHLNVGISGNAGAILSQGINFSNDYVQSANATETADMVLVDCNQCYFGPNFKVIPAASMGGFIPFHITTGANGDGRGNQLFASSVAGGTAPATCIQIDEALGSTTGPQGNVIGPGNSIENCAIGVLVTGGANAAINNVVEHNYWLNDTAQVKVDFSIGTQVLENTNGNAATVLFTANGQGNTFFGHLGNTTADISDLGTADAIMASQNVSGASILNLLGQISTTNIAVSSLTNGKCVQAGVGGLLGSSALACGPPAIQVYQLASIGGASITGGVATSIGNVALTMPASGGPFRIQCAYNINTNLSTTMVNGWITDGSNLFAGSQAANPVSSGFSPVTYTNGTPVTFTLRTEGAGGYTVNAAATNGGPNSTLQCVAMASN